MVLVLDGSLFAHRCRSEEGLAALAGHAYARCDRRDTGKKTLLEAAVSTPPRANLTLAMDPWHHAPLPPNVLQDSHLRQGSTPAAAAPCFTADFANA